MVVRGTGGRRLKVGVSFDAYHKAGAKGATIILQGAPENGDQTHAPLSRTAHVHSLTRPHKRNASVALHVTGERPRLEGVASTLRAC